jgi:hypothetical protein
MKKQFYDAWVKNGLPNFRKFVPSLPKDNPYLDPNYVKQLENLKIDAPNSYKRLVLGDWNYEESADGLFRFDSLSQMYINNVSTGNDIYYITVDVSRKGVDKSTIFLWKGLHVVRIYELDTPDTTILAAKVNELIDQFHISKQHVIMDENGVGGPVIDMVGCLGFINNAKAINGENYNHLKSQCYYKLSEYVSDEKVSIGSITPDMMINLNQELEAHKQYNFEKDAKQQISPKALVKAEIGRSPDLSDAFMMRMYFELSHTVPKKDRFVSVRPLVF